MRQAVLILAAGASSRMQGRDKLMEIVDDRPLLRLMVLRALSVCDNVIVTLPEDKPERVKTLSDLDVSTVSVPDSHEGISASIRAGVKAAMDCDALMILPADLPELREEELAKSWECFINHAGKSIVRGATSDGSVGHPVIIPKKHFGQLKRLKGDTGANSLIRTIGYIPCPLGEDRALIDLDTPEDWSSWKSRKS